MIATVTRAVPDRISVRVRRSGAMWDLYLTPRQIAASGLKVGDRVTVTRQTNNPYLVLVPEEN